jgi:DNA-binding winged helix-turn-helix (wHTH) protein
MRLTFDDFIFDSDTRELLRARQPVMLSPKAFQLLETLIENRPKAFSKSQLHDRLWPNTFVVEANLSNLIGEIRRALHDDPKRPRFVRTIHRYGYAFRAEPTESARGVATAVVCRLIWDGGGVTLSAGQHIIGRDPDAGVFLDSPGVSRRHARISIADSGATLEDLGSKNGSYVGGRRIEGPLPLADGDVITTGVVEMTFRLVQPSIPTESVL